MRVIRHTPLFVPSNCRSPYSFVVRGIARCSDHIPSKEQRRWEEFMQLCSSIESDLKTKLRVPNVMKLRSVLSQARPRFPAVDKHWETLSTMCMIRNASVHHRSYPANIAAVPSAHFVGLLRNAARDVLHSAECLVPRFKKSVRIFEGTETAWVVANFMMEHKFSQVVVRRTNGQWGLLGSNVLFLALLTGQVTDLQKTPINTLMSLETPRNWRFLSQDKTVEDARAIFRRDMAKGTRDVYAVLITDNGRPDGVILGIVTTADLATID